MVAENFDRCLAFVLKEEGGDDDDPRDHGGRTSRGITQRVYDAYRARKNEAPADVWRASTEEVRDIYKTQYWNPYCDGLPSGVDLMFFDYCVNAGRTQAVRDLQRCLGVPVDGMYGMRTDHAVKEANAHDLIESYAERREAFYRALKQFKVYGRGWLGRTNRVRLLALSMSGAESTVQHISADPVSPKANASDVKSGPISAENAATGSGASAGLYGLIDQAKEMLSPYADVIQYVKYALLVLTFLGVAFMAYDFVQRQRAKEVT